MSRSGDSQGITLTQVGITFGIFAALIGAVLQVSGALGDHNESEVAHPKEAAINAEKIESHDSDTYAHEPMRQMFREELRNAMQSQTVELVEEIRKIRE